MACNLRAELRKSVKDRDTKGTLSCMSDMLSFILEAFNEAAELDDRETVGRMMHCYDTWSLKCSGALMEVLLAKGNTDLASMFITNGKWWGSAKTQWADFNSEKSEK